MSHGGHSVNTAYKQDKKKTNQGRAVHQISVTLAGSVSAALEALNKRAV